MSEKNQRAWWCACRGEGEGVKMAAGSWDLLMTGKGLSLDASSLTSKRNHPWVLNKVEDFYGLETKH
jgi:hypothetical protein